MSSHQFTAKYTNVRVSLSSAIGTYVYYSYVFINLILLLTLNKLYSISMFNLRVIKFEVKSSHERGRNFICM